MVDVRLSEGLRGSIGALGEVGAQWLEQLPRTVDALAQRWRLDIDPQGVEASTGFVAHAVTARGERCVLKVAMPAGIEGFPSFDLEAMVLVAAEGRGYARVLEHDDAARALLLERLGRRLADVGLSVPALLEVVATTLAAGWEVPPPPALPTGDEKARWLADFIRRLADENPTSCPTHVVEQAVSCAEGLAVAFDAADAVLVHGDAHVDNVLESPDGIGFRMIDPEGIRSDQAHDFGIAIRDWNAPLLESDSPQRLLAEWCARLRGLTDVAPDAIQRWCFVEKVSTGLFLEQLGNDDGARRYFATAEAVAASSS